MILKSLDVVNDVRILESRGARLANLVQGDGAHDDARDGDDEAQRRERLGGSSFSLRHAGVRAVHFVHCLLYTSPSPRDATLSRMPSSA